MDASDVLKERAPTIGALVLAVVLVAIGVQQAALRVGEVEPAVLVPLAVTIALVGLVVVAGLRAGCRIAAGDRRTPYW